MKLVISNKQGKAKQVEIEDNVASSLYGIKIGDKFNGNLVNMEGYEFEVRGGSDDAGFPMRRDVQGMERKAILATSGLGNHIKRKGMRKRKTVAGNTIAEATAQVNLYVIKKGKEDLFAEPVTEEKKEEETTEEKKEE